MPEKSTKRFIISDSRLNAQGFRMLTEGALLDDFEKNPLMLWNHQRPEGTDKNQILPIGHWEDIEVNGDEISGVPVFDDKDEFAMSIFHKVEGGHIRMCSAGAEPLETSEEESVLLPEQSKATVTKWRLKEASIVDIGANPGALAVALYDANDNLIRLSDPLLKNLIPNITMTKKTTTAKVAAAKVAAAEAAKAEKVALAAKKVAVQLAEEAKEEGEAKLADNDGEAQLAEEEPEEDKDEIIAKLTAQVAELTEKLKLAEEQVSLADTEKEEAKVEQLANKAIALKKITLAQKPHIIKLAKADYNGTVEYLNGIRPQKSVKEIIELSDNGGDGKSDEIAKLSAMSWDTLFNTKGAIITLKAQAPDVYKAKFKEKFGKNPIN